MYEHAERRQYLLDRLHGRRRVLVAAQVHDHPRDVAQEADGDCGIDERQQRLHDAQTDHVVATLWTVTCVIAYRNIQYIAALAAGR